MKNTIINLYQRDYFTFYIVIYTLDILIMFITKIPILTLTIVGIMLTLSSVQILKKFKK